jgi:XTP/dITP diphosphohydrolase
VEASREGGSDLIFATANKHKLREMRELLAGLALEPLPEGLELPPEEGESYATIALDKARAARAATGMAAIGDDSGIEAAGLDGRPGIHSARYGGLGATDEENLEKLLREVGEAGADRRAAYHCALALVEADGSERVFEARCEGRLIEARRGDGGFGYDPAFVPDATGPDDDRTMSELSQAEKNEISHRGVAARMLAAHLGYDKVAPGAR